MEMKRNRAPSPDGFPTEFYKKNWEVIKGDLMAMFDGAVMNSAREFVGV
jgi:hypothetical protein